MRRADDVIIVEYSDGKSETKQNSETAIYFNINIKTRASRRER